MDNTLQDEGWKDPFDKLLDSRRILRQYNTLRKDVRASYNMDSSFENSHYEHFIHKSIIENQIPSRMVNLRQVESTPSVMRCSGNPFQCDISPIRRWNSFSNVNSKKLCSLNKEQEPEIEFEKFNNGRKIVNGVKNTWFKDHDGLNKKVCFNITKVENYNNIKIVNDKNKSTLLTLEPGKWRKSLNNWLRNYRISEKFGISEAEYNTGKNSLTAENPFQFVGVRKTIFIKSKRRTTFIKQPRVDESDNFSQSEVLKQCNQQKPIPFNKILTSKTMLNSIKVGEGAYGEVFLNSELGKSKCVFKIIPIEGFLEINGEMQKTFEQILPEILISKELSALRNIENEKFTTQNFVQVNKVSLVKGKYPKYLVKLWEDYDKKKLSENDHPGVFGKSQLYIVLELQFAGEDLSSFKFTNAEQSYYALLQIIFAMAVGEQAFQFEHRDLHLGNVLIINTQEKKVVCKLDGKVLAVPTKGIKVTIIDYTLSRMMLKDCCLYNDLSCDEELFAATGDYQYDIYRMMQNILKNNWSTYEPKTNIFWISYIVSKLINGVEYKNTNTKLHKLYMQKLKNLQKSLLNFRSAFHYMKHLRKLA